MGMYETQASKYEQDYRRIYADEMGRKRIIAMTKQPNNFMWPKSIRITYIEHTLSNDCGRNDQAANGKVSETIRGRKVKRTKRPGTVTSAPVISSPGTFRTSFILHSNFFLFYNDTSELYNKLSSQKLKKRII